MFNSVVLEPLRGLKKLWIIFFIYYVPGVFIIDFVIRNLRLSPELTHKVYFLTLVVFAMYMGISFWQCAFNSRFNWLGYIVRILVAFNLIAVPYLVYVAFFGNP